MGEDYDVEEIPADLLEAAKEARATLIERVADVDDDIMELYLEGEEPSVAQMLAEQTLSAPSVAGINFKPETARFLAYPDTKATDLGLFTPDWKYIIPRRAQWLEKYNQTFNG